MWENSADIQQVYGQPSLEGLAPGAEKAQTFLTTGCGVDASGMRMRYSAALCTEEDFGVHL